MNVDTDVFPRSSIVKKENELDKEDCKVNNTFVYGPETHEAKAGKSSNKKQPLLKVNQLNNEDNSNKTTITASSSIKQDNEPNGDCHIITIKQEFSHTHISNNYLQINFPKFNTTKKDIINGKNSETKHSFSDEDIAKCEVDCNCMLLKVNEEELNIKEEQLTSSSVCEGFPCYICNSKLLSKGALRRHLRLHRNENPNRCSICNCNCDSKSELTIHSRIHTGEKPFSCPICSYKFSRKGSLTRHLRIHKGEKQFSCTSCDYKCFVKSALVRHLRTHTGEKPFSCTICNYKCSVKCGLIQHSRIHTGEKPFGCSICSFKYSSNSGLKAHLRTHTHEKPFHCTICDYKAPDKSTLRRHLQIHKPVNISICNYKCSETCIATSSGITDN